MYVKVVHNRLLTVNIYKSTLSYVYTD